MSVLHVFHGGAFVWTPHLEYCEGSITVKNDIDPDYLSVDDIKDLVIGLGYGEHRVGNIYLRKPNLPFDKDALLPIVTDKEVREVINLCCSMPFVELYVEHTDVDNWVQMDISASAGLDDIELEISDHEFDDVDDEDDYEPSDGSDEEYVMYKTKMKTAREEKKLEESVVGKTNGKHASEKAGPSKTNFDECDGEYYDSDDANSPCESESEGDDDHTKKRRKRPQGFRYNPAIEGDDPKLLVGHQFSDKVSLRKAVQHYTIMKGYEIFIKKSDKNRFQAQCYGQGCEWKLWCSPVQKQKTWEIKSISKDHSCVPYNYGKGKRRITTQWLSDYFLEQFRLHPHMKLREIKTMMERCVDYSISLKMCSKARNRAMALIIGDYKEQFAQVRDYAEEILKHNPQSTVVVTTSRATENSPCVFSGIYVCLGALKKGMLEGCRPVISVDGCFIKGPWTGQILVAVGRDGNNQMFPVAWAVTERENGATWKWFMDLLASDLEMGDGNGWTVISDQQKGLVDSIAQILPRAEHRLCARHVYANLRKRFKGLQYREIFWKIAKSTHEPDYNRHMQLMNELDQDAWKFLVDKKPEHWCRAFFKFHAKTDSVDNNMAEIFNAFILEARYKPILSMLDEIFTSVMTRFATKQEVAEAYANQFCPRILKKLQANKETAKFWKPDGGSNGKFQVRHGADGYVVSIAARTCTCRAWQLTGIPCPHAVATMRKANLTCEDFLDEFYTMNKYKKAYAHGINPVNGKNMWAKASGDPIHAPEFKNTKKNLGFKRRLEEGDSLGKKTKFGKVSRVGHKKTCSKCHVQGHTSKTCKTPTPNAPQPTAHSSSPAPQPTAHSSTPATQPSAHSSAPTLVPTPTPSPTPAPSSAPATQLNPAPSNTRIPKLPIRRAAATTSSSRPPVATSTPSSRPPVAATSTPSSRPAVAATSTPPPASTSPRRPPAATETQPLRRSPRSKVKQQEAARSSTNQQNTGQTSNKQNKYPSFWM